MDKGFMSKFYERMVEEDLYELLCCNEEYVRIQKRRIELGSLVRKTLEGKALERFEDYDETINEMLGSVQQVLYLKGAEDRERMLR